MKKLLIISSLLFLLVGCATKTAQIEQKAPILPQTTPFSVVLIDKCAGDECKQKPLDRATKALEKKLTKTYIKIQTDFVLQNSLGDQEVAEWLVESSAHKLEALIKDAKTLAFLDSKNQRVLHYGITKQAAKAKITKAIKDVLSEDQFLHAQAELIRAYEWLDDYIDKL